MSSTTPAAAAAAASPAAASTATTTTAASFSSTSTWGHAALRRLRFPAALASLAVAAYVYQEYSALQKLKAWETGPNQKLALSIAFDQLELVQQPLSAQRKLLQRLLWQARQKANKKKPFWNNDNDSSGDDNDDDPLSASKHTDEKCTLSVVELVRLLHAAAQDRHIGALFGTFGHVTGQPTAPTTMSNTPGWSDWEEIRNALTVFAQAHRRHYDPHYNTDSTTTTTTSSTTEPHYTGDHHPANVAASVPRVDKKPMYCFANNLGSAMTNPGNPTYYLASVFHRIHLQTHGELELLGVLQQHVFLKPLLEKYGIQFHVLKQGAYKTAPNTLTEATFTKAHKESAANLVSELDANLSLEITHSRSKALLTSWLATKGSGGKATPRQDPTAGMVALGDGSSTKNSSTMLPLQPHSTLSPTNIMTTTTTTTGSSNDKSKNASATAANTTTISYADLSNAKILQLWHRIHEAGTFPAHTAWQAGLVDCLSRRHPLQALLAYNRAKAENNTALCAHILSQWEPHETDFDHFGTATKAISLADYQRHYENRMRWMNKRSAWYAWCSETLGWSDAMIPSLLKKPTTSTPAASDSVAAAVPKSKPPRERVVCLDVVGAIDDAKARSVVSKLRALQALTAKPPKKKEDDLSDANQTTPPSPKNDENPEVKCLVLRIVSPGGQIFACEQISQELKALNIPVVVSFGNVAASGGYYIAAHANRIFGSLKTITGSIGVFGVRADLSNWAKQNGIRVEHVASGSLAASYSAFCPMTAAMKQNMAYSIDRWYDLFQQVVQEGRGLSPETVHELAQGKVWTGRQAKEVGLLDEIGGFERALAFAKRTYCTGPPDQVDVGRLVATTSPSASTESSKMMWNPWALLHNYLGNNSGTSSNRSIGPYQWQSDNGVALDSWASSLVVDCEEDENDAECTNSTMAASHLSDWLLRQIMSPSHSVQQQQQLAPSLSGILMTADESSAIQVLLQDQYRHSSSKNNHHHHHHNNNKTI
ncbi:hypothetical protein ACA910_019369 [Epithemia clementina (nom. ined.)]